MKATHEGIQQCIHDKVHTKIMTQLTSKVAKLKVFPPMKCTCTFDIEQL